MMYKNIFLYILIIFFLASSSGNLVKEKEEETAQTLLEKSRVLYLNSSYKEAIKSYKKLIEQFPEDIYEKAWAHYEMGICYYLLKDYKTARESFVTILRYYPSPRSARILSLQLIRKIDQKDYYKRSSY